MRKKLLMATTLAFIGVFIVHANVEWVDKTSLITNPSFETDAAISDLTVADNKNNPTGWTITYDTGASNKNTQQWGTANSSSTIQGIGSSHAPSAGDNYFYLRENWHHSTTYEVKQDIVAGDNLPIGIYILTVKIATYAPSGKTCTYKLCLQEEGESEATSQTTTISSSWNTLKVWINKKSKDTKLTVKATMKASESNSGQSWCMLLDDFQLSYGDYSSATTSSTLDVTDLVTNPTFDTNISGWTSYLNATNNKVSNNRTEETTNFWENWHPGNSGRMFQTISNLPSGTYKLRMMAFAQDKGTMTPANTDVAVYAKGNNDNIRRNYVNSTAFTYYNTYAYVDASGSLEIGLRADVNTFEWLGMDNVTLEYLSNSNNEETLLLEELQSKWSDVTTECNLLENIDYTNVTGVERTNLSTALGATVSTIADYATNAATLQTAYLAFIDAKTNYDKYAEETARAIAMGVDAGDIPELTSSENYLTTLHDLIVLEDAAVTTGYPKDATGVVDEWNVASGVKNTWTPQNAGTNDNNHWSGETKTYYNTYKEEGFTMSAYKIVSLPAGSYVLKAAARCNKVNEADQFYLGVTVDGNLTKEIYTSTGGGTGLGIDKTGAANYTEAYDTYANSNNGYGWEWRFVPFVLTEAKEVQLKITANILATGWVSFSDIQLLTTSENVDVFAQIYNTAKTSAESARDHANYENVKGVERKGLVDAINESATSSINWYSSQKTALDAAITTFVDAKTNYNSLATAINNANTIVTNSINVGDGAFQVPTSIKTTLAEAKATAEGIKSNETTTSSYAATAATTLNTAIDTYNTDFAKAELNAPAEGDAFNLYLDDGLEKTVTFKAGNETSGGYAIGYTDDAGSLYNQAIHFKSTGTKNQYKLYIIDDAGGKHYLCTGTVYSGNNNQIRVTDNEENALAVEVIVTTSDGVYNLNNTAANALIGSNGDTGVYTAQTYKNFNINAATKASVEVSIGAGEIATRIFPFTPELPSGVVAYSCSAVSGTNLTLVKEDTPAANTPYILYSESGCLSTNLEGYGVAKTNVYPAGYLTGVFTRTEVPVNSYVLQKKDETLGFYRVSATGQYSSPYRVYVTVPSGDVKSFGFTLDDIETAIRAAEAEGQTTVTLRYNAAGQQIQSAQKGLNIIRMSDGSVRKVLVK